LFDDDDDDDDNNNNLLEKFTQKDNKGKLKEKTPTYQKAKLLAVDNV